MKCEFCGHDHGNEEEVIFCGNCGAQLSNAPTSTPTRGENRINIDEDAIGVTEPDKTAPKKRLLKLAMPVVLVIAALLIVIPMLRGPDIFMVKDSINFFSDGDSVIVSGNNNAKFTINGIMGQWECSMDGSKAVLLTDYDNTAGGILWFVTTSNYTRIADDVVAFKLADSGDGVVYYTNYDSNNSTASLYLYDTSSKKTTIITDEAMYAMYGSSNLNSWVCISPNGKSVGYAIGDFNYMNPDMTGYVKIDSKSAERLGNSMFAVAISDGGRYVYYLKAGNEGWGDPSLHVKSGRSENRLVPSGSLQGVLFALNKDYSEFLFIVDGRTFLSRKGGERTDISGFAMYDLILPRGTQTLFVMNAIKVYGVRSFANTIAIGGGGLEYINKSFETVRIPVSGSGWYDWVVSKDGKSLLVINAGTLMRLNPTKSDAEINEIAREVRAFVASSDGKTVYYVNYDGELWCIKGNKRPSRVANYVSADTLALPYNSSKLFFLADFVQSRGGELHYSNNGKKSVKITDEVKNVWNTPTSVFYRTIDNDIYRSSGNGKFTLFQVDIILIPNKIY